MTSEQPGQPPARRRGRPATGITPKRNVRIGADWDRLEALAAEQGETITDAVKKAVAAEVRRRERRKRTAETVAAE